jgi:hypothetical protein
MSKDIKVDNSGQKELKKVEKEFENFNKEVKEVSEKALFTPPLEEKKELDPSIPKDAIVLSPIKKINSQEPFNENFREDYNYKNENICFIAENIEISGEDISLWTKPFAGMSAMEWSVPVNKPVVGPRYLYEQIASKFYNRLVMDQKPIQSESGMTYYGTMVATNTIHRLNAHEFVNRPKFISMRKVS